MGHIQDFNKEVGDTTRIIYAQLASFACESGDALTEGELVKLYIGKQSKDICNMAHPHMLLFYGGQTTLAHAFEIVE